MIKRKQTKKRKSKKRKNPIEDRIISDNKILLTLYLQFVSTRISKKLENPQSVYNLLPDEYLQEASHLIHDLALSLGIDIPEPPNKNSDEEFIVFLQQIAKSQNWTRSLKKMDDTQVISRSQLLRLGNNL